MARQPMTPAQAILRTLIQEYGPALHLPAGDNQTAAYYYCVIKLVFDVSIPRLIVFVW